MKTLLKIPLLLMASLALCSIASAAEKSAYLGVVTSPVAGALSHQLGLSAGTGLVVDYVAPESAAHNQLKQHDVLTKFENQILISQHQLAVLVRSKKAGDEVGLTVFRKGKEETVSVTLGEKELPALDAVEWGNMELNMDPSSFSSGFGLDDEAIQKAIQDAMSNRGDAKKIQEQIQKQIQQMQKQHKKQGGGTHMFFGVPGGGADPFGGGAQIEINPGAHSSMTSSIMIDGDRTIMITDKNGDRHLKVKSKDGDVIFDGSVNTQEERAGVPADVKPMLDSIRINRMEAKKKAL